MQVKSRKKDWVNIVFFTLTPVIGSVGTALWTYKAGFSWWMPALMLTLYALTGISITAGYHRFFSHKTFECSPVVQAFFAFFGAFAAQDSILWWSAGHRIHHKHVDTDWDPYSIKRGFWWAHILWLFKKSPKGHYDNVPDLYENKIVMWQHKWHRIIMIVCGFGLPALVGALYGNWLAGLLWGGFSRLVLLHQTTFFVNSLAHTMGRPTFNAETSARDNWLVALVTFGEGYHSFHHRFPADFRNGIRWYQWDPSKWLIGSLKAVGLVSDLRTTPLPQIEQARMQAALRIVEAKIETADASVAHAIRERLHSALNDLEIAFALWRQHVTERAEGLSTKWRTTRRQAKRHVRQSRRSWKDAVRMIQRLPQAA
jgi:stearoyl-CoA desaturase (delta-9 desaturase)